jgi:hypothetical protein
MYISKLALPRRTFLRGLGTAIALPLLDAMVPALSALANTPAKPARRLGFVYVPNGVIQDQWVPKTTGAGCELSPSLKPLENVKDHLLVISGLAQKQAESFGDGNGDHARGCASWLNGVHPKRTEGAGVQAGTTIDQIAARELGQLTRLPSLELALESQERGLGSCDNGYACVYINTISWRSPTSPVPMEIHPRVVFDRLFGDGGSADARLAQARRSRSVLDSVRQEVASLEKSLGAGDKTKVSEYLESVREVEQRIQRAEAQTGEISLTLPDRPTDIPEEFAEHMRLMFDLQVLAFQADITRVTSLLIGREQSGRSFPEIGIAEPHHSLSHHRDDPVFIAKKAKIDAYHVQLYSYFLEKLKATPDGDGSLLDHSAILYGGGLGNPNLHEHSNLPVLIAGRAGGLKTGQHLAFPENTPMTNLLLSLLDKVGVRTESLGDSTGRLEQLI